MNKQDSRASTNGTADKIKINDFVIRFANVNGTGLASANALFSKAVFRMGVPVTPKNIRSEPGAIATEFFGRC